MVCALCALCVLCARCALCATSPERLAEDIVRDRHYMFDSFAPIILTMMFDVFAPPTMHFSSNTAVLLAPR